MSKNNKHKTPIEILYDRYEYMAAVYANKIFNFERHGYEKDDIIQELRIKIYTSIVAYSEKWLEFKKTGRYKPVPIVFYIKAAMVNKNKDFIKLFNASSVENVEKISVQNDGFDYSTYSTLESNIDLNNCVCEINGINLFQSLRGRKKQIFALYLKGFTVIELDFMFSKIDVPTLIKNQTDLIKNKKEQLLDYNNSSYTVVTVDEG